MLFPNIFHVISGERIMDWLEAVRHMIVLAGLDREFTFIELEQLIPPKVDVTDFERVIETLNAHGIWIADD